jgi:methylamine---glutamate N-methyltransferase subunit A
MCGIAGRILKDPGDVGADLVDLMQAQRHRGADSTGFAVYGQPLEDAYRVKVFVSDRHRADGAITEIEGVLKRHGSDLMAEPEINSAPTKYATLRLVVSDPEAPIAVWVAEIDEIPGIEVMSVGRSLEIVKDEGDASVVAQRHDMTTRGTHGLGHARLATESDVSPIASHPFWARPFPDIAIVHNGQLTNYYLWRRRLEHQGYRFSTDNDSELIAVWISDQMDKGSTLEEALTASITELDGVFTYLLATADVIGLAKDRLAIKPIVAVEEFGEAAMATEEQALRRLYPGESEIVNYDGPAMVRVWDVTAAAGAP